MRIQLAEAALHDLEWYLAYYRRHSDNSAEKAAAALDRIFNVIADNPHIGERDPDRPDIRSFPIPNAPFRVYYLAKPERLTVLRVWDGRRDPAGLEFN
jgi:plasmid stabilization system protein ParE